MARTSPIIFPRPLHLSRWHGALERNRKWTRNLNEYTDCCPKRRVWILFRVICSHRYFFCITCKSGLGLQYDICRKEHCTRYTTCWTSVRFWSSDCLRNRTSFWEHASQWDTKVQITLSVYQLAKEPQGLEELDRYLDDGSDLAGQTDSNKDWLQDRQDAHHRILEAGGERRT